MNVLNKIFYFFFWGVLIFIIATIAFLFSSKIIPGLNKNIVQSGIVAFFGAFFAFIFVKIAESITNIRRANINHFNSLVKIERLLNKIITRLEENILVFQRHKKVLELMGLLSWSSHDIPINNDLMDDLRNLDFINDYFSFSVDIETLNNDFITMKSMYTEMKQSFLNKTINPQDYKDNISNFTKEIEKILKYMINYQEKAIQLSAKTRLLQKEKKNWTFLFGSFHKKKYINNFNKLVEEEIKIVEKEINECRKKSEKEKKEIKEREIKSI